MLYQAETSSCDEACFVWLWMYQYQRITASNLLVPDGDPLVPELVQR